MWPDERNDQFITDKPNFVDLHNLMNATDDVLKSIVALGDTDRGGDVAQRATDILSAIQNLVDMAKETLTEEIPF